MAHPRAEWIELFLGKVHYENVSLARLKETPPGVVRKFWTSSSCRWRSGTSQSINLFVVSLFAWWTAQTSEKFLTIRAASPTRRLVFLETFISADAGPGASVNIDHACQKNMLDKNVYRESQLFMRRSSKGKRFSLLILMYHHNPYAPSWIHIACFMSWQNIDLGARESEAETKKLLIDFISELKGCGGVYLKGYDGALANSLGQEYSTFSKLKSSQKAPLGLNFSMTYDSNNKLSHYQRALGWISIFRALPALI